MPDTTWDGLPIADDDPRGAGVVTRRARPDGTWEYLMLHRHHEGPDYEGDWAWTSPSGARLPGEPILTGAERELFEEAGLSGCDLRPVDLSGGWAAFATQVPPGTEIVIDPEHDRYAWTTRAEAVARIAPAGVAALFQRGADLPLPRIEFADGVVVVDGEPAGKVTATSDGDAVTVAAEAFAGPLGPQIAWVYLRDVVLADHPQVARIVVQPAVGDLDRAGFVRDGDAWVLDRRRVFG